MSRAVFLDRDGTINREVSFVRSPDQLEVLPGVPDALARLRAAGFQLVVLTNQSGIARGYYAERDLAAIHAELQRRLVVPISAWLHCPHHPEQDGPYGRACACRKPGPGLLDEARELLGVSFEGSFAVGDSARDILMARDLPIRTVQVASGKPLDRELETLRRQGHSADAVCDDLAAAADWILGQR